MCTIRARRKIVWSSSNLSFDSSHDFFIVKRSWPSLSFKTIRNIFVFRIQISIFLIPMILLPGPLPVGYWTNPPEWNCFHQLTPIIVVQTVLLPMSPNNVIDDFHGVHCFCRVTSQSEGPDVAEKLFFKKYHPRTSRSPSSPKNALFWMSLTSSSSDFFFSERHIGLMVIRAVSGARLVAKQERQNFSKHSSFDLDPQNWCFPRVVLLLLCSYMIK